MTKVKAHEVVCVCCNSYFIWIPDEKKEPPVYTEISIGGKTYVRGDCGEHPIDEVRYAMNHHDLHRKLRPPDKRTTIFRFGGFYGAIEEGDERGTLIYTLPVRKRALEELLEWADKYHYLITNVGRIQGESLVIILND